MYYISGTVGKVRLTLLRKNMRLPDILQYMEDNFAFEKQDHSAGGIMSGNKGNMMRFKGEYV